jgi:hypothetical protein
VVCWGKVLGEVVNVVFCVWAPYDLMLTLLGSVSEPVKTHVDCFRLALFDGVIEDSFGTLVVSSKHCGRLGVAQLKEHLSDGAAVLGLHECGPHFHFHC